MIQKKNNSQHEFAIYLAKTSQLASTHSIDDDICLNNPQLFHRIVKVLRLTSDETYIIFDQKYYIRCRLLSINKKNIMCNKIIDIQRNPTFKPYITFLLPLLKREAFQESLYTLTELGASTIIPIITKKIQRTWRHPHEYDRLTRIIHAAAEQSKNFSFPSLNTPQSLEKAVSQLQSNARIFFDPSGDPLLPVILNFSKSQPLTIALMIGPEADLLSEEKDLLRANNFKFCRLTPTILRAQQAATISLGTVRSLL